jgi:guanylate kinase
MADSGMLVIISGPSGSGKGTVVKKLCPENNFALSISMTTRNPRPNEIDGVDYFFCTPDEFKKVRDNNGLLEHAQFCGNFYGTPRFYVEEQIKKNKFVVLEIDVNGALQVKEKFDNCVLIFLIPPSMEELANRLINRDTESIETIEDRLNRAHEEVKLIDKYDYIIINDDVDKAVEKINTVVTAENLKPFRNTSIIKKLNGSEN